MNKRWRDVGLDIFLAILWFVTGYLAFSGLFGWGSQGAWIGALINIILGLILVAWASMHEEVARQLYRGERQEGVPFRLLLALLILIPYFCLFFAAIVWLMRLLGVLKF